MPSTRRTDPETSHEAEHSINNVCESQKTILNVLRTFGPMTDEDIYQLILAIPISLSGARTRRSELVHKGLVKDSGQRKYLSTGRRAILWEIV